MTDSKLSCSRGEHPVVKYKITTKDECKAVGYLFVASFASLAIECVGFVFFHRPPQGVDCNRSVTRASGLPKIDQGSAIKANWVCLIWYARGVPRMRAYFVKRPDGTVGYYNGKAPTKSTFAIVLYVTALLTVFSAIVAVVYTIKYMKEAYAWIINFLGIMKCGEAFEVSILYCHYNLTPVPSAHPS